MTVKKSEIIFNTNITKKDYENLYNKFIEHNGCITKLIDKKHNALIGYLVRAEIPEFNNFIGVSFVPVETKKYSIRFYKSVAINKVLNGGQRKLKRFLKKYGSLNEFKTESIMKLFIEPQQLSKNIIDYYKSSNFSYDDIYNYIIAFENKIKAYYKNNDKNIVIINI